MSQRIAFFIAAGLTAFVLVVGGAVAGRMSQLPRPPAAPSAEPTAAEEASPPADVQTLLEREAAYQELVRQANERLQKVYAESQPTAQATAAAFAISPEQAAAIALQAVPGAVLLRLPELVDFQGTMAYEIALDLGMLYIDANTGQILYNGTTTVPGPVTLASTSSHGNDRYEHDAGNSGSNEGEHEEEDEEEGDH